MINANTCHISAALPKYQEYKQCQHVVQKFGAQPTPPTIPSNIKLFDPTIYKHSFPIRFLTRYGKLPRYPSQSLPHGSSADNALQMLLHQQAVFCHVSIFVSQFQSSCHIFCLLLRMEQYLHFSSIASATPPLYTNTFLCCRFKNHQFFSVSKVYASFAASYLLYPLPNK